MKKIIISLAIEMLAFVCASATAQDDVVVRALEPAIFQNCSRSDLSTINVNEPHFRCVQQGADPQTTEPVDVSVKTTHAGELAELLGDDVTVIDALHVEGPINGEDFNTIWNSTFNGRLKVIDLGAASVEGGIIPDYALFHTDAQMDWDRGIITTVWLEKLTLPSNTVEIGRHAFAYATSLDEIKFPESLKRIGTSSFTDCIKLATNPFVLPSNLEYLGYQAFYQCYSLAGEVFLPPTLKVIDGAAFYRTRINKIIIPESVEYLGDFAFYGSRLKEIDVPDGCYLDTRGAQFYCNYELERAHIPETCEQIPDDIFSGCIKLKNVNMPAGVKLIRQHAFEGCRELESFTSLVLPEGLEAIAQRAFSDTPIMEITFPSTLTYIGAEMFGFRSSFGRIYCKATVPPECHDWELRPGESPFYGIPEDVVVYIPVGTSDSYRAAWGWDYFTNFIETDNFPSAGVVEVSRDVMGQNCPTYDLYGRKVERLIPGNIYICGGKKFIYKPKD